MKFYTKTLRTPGKRQWLLCVLLAVVAAGLILLWMPITPGGGTNRGNRHLASSERQTNGPAVGQLGGVPVSIPGPYANFVEYDDATQPTRTVASKLSSFGFAVRFPDMAVMPVTATSQGPKEDIYSTTRMRVGVNSNRAYGSSGDTVLEAYIGSIPTQQGSIYRYEKLPQLHYGLTGYTPVEPDFSRRSTVGMADERDKNIYFHRDRQGRADVYIECSNALHAAARCELRFNMLPDLRAHVSVNFRREMLPHWREIQSSIRSVILGFRVDPTTTSNTNNQTGK